MQSLKYYFYLFFFFELIAIPPEQPQNPILEITQNLDYSKADAKKHFLSTYGWY